MILEKITILLIFYNYFIHHVAWDYVTVKHSANELVYYLTDILRFFNIIILFYVLYFISILHEHLKISLAFSKIIFSRFFQ